MINRRLVDTSKTNGSQKNIELYSAFISLEVYQCTHLSIIDINISRKWNAGATPWLRPLQVAERQAPEHLCGSDSETPSLHC